MSKTEKFFKNDWNKGINRLKWIIIFLSVSWCIFAAFKVAEIGPLTEPEEIVDINHPSQKSQKILQQNFVSQFSKINVDFIFGVKGIDRTGDSMWDSFFIGEAILDDKFDAGC